ncbi:MAG: hypothetical protein GY795_31405 [Desulfobacterales bacterium]|nr:hypothetical protein [Desulfobacterales bacterium]
MKISNLTSEVIEKIKLYRWDRIIEKHEGPERWESVLKYYDPEFMEIMGHYVLLPIDRDRHRNVTILRCIEGDNGSVLTIFLKDTTYVSNPDDEIFDAGFVAVCDKFPGEEFYIAVLYHEWFIVENS